MLLELILAIWCVIGIILIVLVIYDIHSKKYVIKKLRETNEALYNELIELKGE